MMTLGVQADVAEGGVYPVYDRLAPQISYRSEIHGYGTVNTCFLNIDRCGVIPDSVN